MIEHSMIRKKLLTKVPNNFVKNPLAVVGVVLLKNLVKERLACQMVKLVSSRVASFLHFSCLNNHPSNQPLSNAINLTSNK